MARCPQCGRDTSVVYMGYEDEHLCHECAYQFDAREEDPEYKRRDRPDMSYLD
jgi:transposase-like protein